MQEVITHIAYSVSVKMCAINSVTHTLYLKTYSVPYGLCNHTLRSWHDCTLLLLVVLNMVWIGT